MKLIIIEDDYSKASKIIDFLSSLPFNNSFELYKSYSTGIRAVRDLEIDVLLLDMSLPLYDGDDLKTTEFTTFAGKRILEEISRINKLCKVIVITAFDYLPYGDTEISLNQLDKEMMSNYSKYYVGSIRFDLITGKWSNVLLKYLLKIEGELTK